MLELAVATLGFHLIPPIVLDDADRLANFDGHSQTVAVPSSASMSSMSSMTTSGPRLPRAGGGCKDFYLK